MGLLQVPWLAEECLLRLHKGDPAAAPLTTLAYILAGGAALSEELMLPICRAHGIALWPHYGQTELGGPALLGGLAGSLAAMRAPPGVAWELFDDNGDASTANGAEDELILHGMLCATRGYLPGCGGRDLAGGTGKTTHEHFCTGDIFRTSAPVRCGRGL